MDDVLTAGVLGWVLPVLAALLAVGWYLSYLARRLDRLHHRVESAAAALREQLVRRAAAAVRVAGTLPAGTGDELALAGTEAAEDPGDEAAQNRLTRCIRTSLDSLAGDVPGDWPARPEIAVLNTGLVTGLITELSEAAHRAQLARRFHNDAVAHAQRMRRKRVVRWARLAGRAAWPAMVEIDDELPESLVAAPV